MAMQILDCLLRVDSPIYYATREVGRLYETGDHLHNYALTYALGLVKNPYHTTATRPTYKADFAPLIEQGIYVTPAAPQDVSHMVSQIKFGSESLHENIGGERKKGNYPNFGRIKEIAPMSTFRFFVLTSVSLTLPRWIRLGIWMSKCEVVVQRVLSPTISHSGGTVVAALNPLDLPALPNSYDIVPMPPNSLIRNAAYDGEAWIANDGLRDIRLPTQMRYLIHGA